jgi:pyruvate,water dikinase
MVKKGQGQKFINQLLDGVATFARAFAPRPVVYRATDFKTNEYKELKGGEKFEKDEPNPMIGYRGALRYLKEPDLLKLELEAIKKVREKEGLKNLWLMIPFVRTLDEIIKIKEQIKASGLEQGPDFKLWLMVEVPATVILIEKFCELGIDGVSIGSNDLTQLILGADRDNPALAEEFDERNEAVVWAMRHTIEVCRQRGVTSSICGQAPSIYPEITEIFVEAGATSVSVNPDMIIPTRKLIASVEQKLSLKKMEHLENEISSIEERLADKLE